MLENYIDYYRIILDLLAYQLNVFNSILIDFIERPSILFAHINLQLNNLSLNSLKSIKLSSAKLAHINRRLNKMINKRNYFLLIHVTHKNHIGYFSEDPFEVLQKFLCHS